MPINFDDVFYTYNPKSPLSQDALNGVSFEIETGSFTALVGHTGSGKSTVVQHINSLLHPQKGSVTVDGFLNSSDKKYNKKQRKKMPELRKHVGLVFQFPEYQLFEETVEKDVAFAPKNFGDKEDVALEKAHKALEKVGLDESFYKRSPFELSGGEKRRVAIAGILAFEPDVLIVDEPTAGLDPNGARKMMGLFKKIHEAGTTIVLVSHDMNLVLAYCDSVIVLDKGKVVRIDKPSNLFKEEIEQYSLETPLLYKFAQDLVKKGMPIELENVHSIDDLLEEIRKHKK